MKSKHVCLCKVFKFIFFRSRDRDRSREDRMRGLRGIGGDRRYRSRRSLSRERKEKEDKFKGSLSEGLQAKEESSEGE